MLISIISPIDIITTDLSRYWGIVSIGLLVLLVLMEILSATKIWNRDIEYAFNIAVIPLTLIFIQILIFKIMHFA